ncbi:MAG TPA: hypothetical protein VM261_02150 [Kofleriaceae bacterium]|nr:hypothetical protein [Kofleriaceae bacterium]
MAWWPAPHERQDDWFADGGIPKSGELVDEACYAECTGCRAELCVEGYPR